MSEPMNERQILGVDFYIGDAQGAISEFRGAVCW